MPSLVFDILYRVTASFKGELPAISPDPVFSGVINQGAAPIQVTMREWPVGIIDWFDLVDIYYLKTGFGYDKLGEWRFLEWDGDDTQGKKNTIQLYPLAEELNGAFTANYSQQPSGTAASAPP